ncbi:MAG TPA: hypothetical protein VFW11_02135 [Cyclobacteriaceae bacterium]|nr:hypothetical protein [Cyclobacteriaceae bacterium]
MKKIIFLFFMGPVLVFGQATEYGAFKIVDTEIVYQKIFFQDSITVGKLAEFMKSVPEFANVSVSNDEVTADLRDLTVDYKKFMFSQVATPPIIQTGRFSGKVTAEAKDGKYRMTVKSLQMKGDIGYKKIPQPENMTNYACMNSGTILSREWCRPNMLGLLEQAITDKFTYKSSKKDSDW